jgi:hypothetical protein
MGSEMIMLLTDSYCLAGKTALLDYNTGNQGLVVELCNICSERSTNPTGRRL